MFKKMMLLASMALATAAFAIPASASANGMFFDNGNPIEGTVPLKLTGTIGFSSGLGNFECEAHPEASIGTTSGTITNLNITTDKCKGTGNLVACELEAHGLTSGEGLNTLTPTAGTNVIDLKKFRLTNKFKNPNCPLTALGSVELRFENIELTVDNPAGITKVTKVSGSGALFAGETPIAGSEAYGELTADAESEGTISFE